MFRCGSPPYWEDITANAIATGETRNFFDSPEAEAGAVSYWAGLDRKYVACSSGVVEWYKDASVPLPLPEIFCVRNDPEDFGPYRVNCDQAC
jgi:hypothetical protein